MSKSIYDLIIVGGGVMGSSTAYHLTKADPTLRMAVVEKDPTYEKASTTLSMANARIQFSLKENIQVSQYALEILERFEEDMAVNGERPNIAYRREGNLFLIPENGRAAAEKSFDLQRELGGEVEWWALETIRAHYPLYNPEGYIAGTFGPKDGHLDAYGLLMAYRAKARSQGAEYIRDEVVAVQKAHGAVSGVSLASGESLNAGIVINCAGAWCSEVARSVGVELPVQPVSRQIFAVSPAIKPERPLPLTILPSGLYFRTETGGLILIGKSLATDRVGFNFNWDPDRFTNELWPEIWAFVPAFDRLKLIRGWAGLYAVNTLDGNAILGEWPELKGFYLANGFSGHGLQQAPAVGRYLMELILGLPASLDLSIFSPGRILKGEAIPENGLV
ncbi:MAG: FAD-binding oxidoreductase [Thermodesulfobacteriota bacterium]